MTADNFGSQFGPNVVPNGRNWNWIKLLTGLGNSRRGHRLTHINFHIKEESILIVLKKESPNGPKVAFLEGTGLDEALWIVASAIRAKAVPWKPDKWRIQRLDKKKAD